MDHLPSHTTSGKHTEVQLSKQSSFSAAGKTTTTTLGHHDDDGDNDNVMFSSYQQPEGIGPAMSKILEKQRLDHPQGDEEVMLRRTRLCYVALGMILLVVYFVLLRKHFFEHHHLPSALDPFSSSSIDDDDDDHKSRSTTTAQMFQLEGSDTKNRKNAADGLYDSEQSCDDGSYSKHTLKPAYDIPFAALFKDTKGQKKYEASDVILVGGNVYAVCDNSWSISRFGDDLTPFSPQNKQIGDPVREGEDDSGFEALFHDNGTFYVLRESVFHQDEGAYHAIIQELDMGEDDYDVKSSCPSEFEFEGDSKGFEGAISLRDTSNELVVLGLCEGNHCSESRKFDIGHGLLVAMKKTLVGVGEDASSCEWSTVGKIKIPPSANFRDYSAATIDETGRVAISSQEDSAIWIGQLMGLDETTGLWDLDKLEFDPDVGKVYSFPKNDNCETIYCNIEGIHWINHEMIIAVSDKMKSQGEQDFRCFDKDQSVHVFVLP